VSKKFSTSLHFSYRYNTEYCSLLLLIIIWSQVTIVPGHTSRIAIMQARGSGKYGSKEPTYNASKVKATSIAKGARIAMLNKQCNVILGSRSKLVIAAAIAIVFVSAHISQHASSYSLSRDRPRIIQITNDYEVKQHDEITTIDVEGAGEIQQPWITEAKIKHGLEDFEEGDCNAMHEWQVKSFPNCNNIHESDFLSYSYITSGGWRDVWRVNEFDNESYVVKTLRWEGHEFRFRDAERHRRDANAYSMAQGSKHIMNIYGYCVNSASFDLVTEGTLNDMMKDKKQMSKLKSKHKLRYAWQIAKSLSDFHSVGNIHGSAAMAHTDITADQFLFFDGKFKVRVTLLAHLSD